MSGCKGHYPVMCNMVLQHTMLTPESHALKTMLIRKTGPNARIHWVVLLIRMGSEQQIVVEASKQYHGRSMGLEMGWEEQSPNSRSWRKEHSSLEQELPSHLASPCPAPLSGS